MSEFDKAKREIINRQKDKENQRRLREKYNEKNDIRIVEKSHFLEHMIRIIASIILYILAAVGLLCLIYPDSRDVLFNIVINTINEIKTPIS